MRINRRRGINKEREAAVISSRTDLGHSEPGGNTIKAANRCSQTPSRIISVTECDTKEVQARSGKEENLSAHPTSIWVPAAANVKWIQHFPSHYPALARSYRFKSTDQSTRADRKSVV